MRPQVVTPAQLSSSVPLRFRKRVQAESMQHCLAWPLGVAEPCPHADARFDRSSDALLDRVAFPLPLSDGTAHTAAATAPMRRSPIIRMPGAVPTGTRHRIHTVPAERKRTCCTLEVNLSLFRKSEWKSTPVRRGDDDLMTINRADRDIDDAGYVVAASAADSVESMSSMFADNGDDHDKGLETRRSIHKPG